MTSAVSGKVRSNEPSSARSPTASASPTATPTSEASTPITSDSSTTARRTWPRVAPIRRSVPSSRVRCATVIDIVLTITKRADEQDHAAEAAQDPRDDVDEQADPLLVVGGALVRRLHLHACATRTAAGAARARSAVTPSAAAIETTSSLPSFCSSRCATGRSNTAIVAPPSELTLPNRPRPTTSNGRRGRQGGDLDRVADRDAVSVGRARVEHDLAVRRSPTSLAETQRVELLVLRPETHHEGGIAGDRLPVRPDDDGVR